MTKIRARGLRALIPIKSRVMPRRKKESVFYVEIRKIKQTQEQIKKEIDKKILDDLTESVKRYGVIQPVVLAKVEKRRNRGINVYYKLVSGQKRLMAAKSAGLRVVPAFIRKINEA